MSVGSFARAYFGALAIGIVIVPAGGSADRLIMHGSACVRRSDDHPASASIDGFGSDSSDPLHPDTFYCPVPTGGATDQGDMFELQNVTSVSLVAYDAWPEHTGELDDVVASVCITYVDGGGTCGVASASSSGYVTLPLATSVWTSSATSAEDYPTIAIRLPARTASHPYQSYVVGYTLSSP